MLENSLDFSLISDYKMIRPNNRNLRKEMVVECYATMLGFAKPGKMFDTGKHRSSHLRCFIKINASKNFAIFTGKHLCWSLFLIKLQAFRPTTLLKKGSNTSVFL